MSSKSDYVQVSDVMDIECPSHVGFFVARLRKWRESNPKKSREDFLRQRLREDFLRQRLGGRDGKLRPCEVAVLVRVFWEPKEGPRTMEEILALL